MLSFLERLYKSSQFNGHQNILEKYLGHSFSSRLPFSIAHGIDYGQMNVPLEIYNPEPIHWCYNYNLQTRARPFKDTILLPHPWSLLCKMNKEAIAQGVGVLVIGTAPGPTNDKNLFESIKNAKLSNVTVLVKARGKYNESMEFWKSNGVNSITVGWNDQNHLMNLFNLLNKFEFVCSGYPSSVIFFAAAMNKKVILFQDFKQHFYDVPGILKMTNFSSVEAKETILLLVSQNYEAISKKSKEILGANLIEDSKGILKKIEDKKNSLRKLVYFHRKENFLINLLRICIAILTNRNKFLVEDWNGLLRKRKFIAIVEYNEVQIWLSPSSHSSLSEKLTKFIPKITEPGYAVRQY